MTDSECVAFLQWALPRLQMRWPGFRKVRGQVCKRLQRRLGILGLGGIADYQDYLETHPDEWKTLDGLCRITISRFYRDREVFDYLGGTVLPRLAGQRTSGLRCWSAGCCSGEEACTLQILWHLRVGSPGDLVVEATDTDAALLERARRGVYAASALHDLPADLADDAFEPTTDGYLLKLQFREKVIFRRQDLRAVMPAGPFDIIFCRNLVFTYYQVELQRALLGRFIERLAEGGVLVVGKREELLELGVSLTREAEAVYRRTSQP